MSRASLPSRRETLLRGLGLLAGAGGLGAAARMTEACLRPNGSNDNLYKQTGTSLQGHLLCLKILVPGVGVGYANRSATFLNCRYAITAAHNIVDLLQYNPTYEVGTGDNYDTNRGTVIPISQCIIHPSYTGTRQNPDIAILRFARPCPIVPDKIIGTAAVNDIVQMAGFGYTGTPSTGLASPIDGHSRGWNGKVVPWTPTESNPLFYQTTAFNSSVPYASQEGKGMSKDSGGPVFKNGQLVGISIAQTGDTSQTGSHIFLNLSSILPWLQANTNPADFTGDGQVKDADFQEFRNCGTRASVPLSPGCEKADFDNDGDVDMDDFGYFQRKYTGS